MPLADQDPELLAENEALRRRVQQLETELATVREQTVQTVATAQETLYWFERWGVDFNALFARPQMEALRRAVRGARGAYRALVSAKRALRS